MKVLEFNVENLWSFDFDAWFVPEVFSSLLVMIIIIIIALIINIKFRKANKNPIGEQKGFVLIVALAIEKLEDFLVGIMGERNRQFSGFILGIGLYVFGAFTFGLTGFASPMSYLGIPLSAALITFIGIHVTSIRDYKWRYFKRYVDPIPVFLPVNLISMWAPLLSLTLRMFGNALGGSCVMALVYFGMKFISASLFGSGFPSEYIMTLSGTTGTIPLNGPAGIFLAPIPAGILHLYFDIFSGLIQTAVFAMLTMILILQEQKPVEEIQVIERDQVTKDQQIS